MNKSELYMWGLLGKLLPQLLFLVTNIVLAHYLSPSDFGTIGVLSIFMMLATTLTEAGLGGSLIKEQNITELDKSTIFVYNIAVSATIYVILYFCAPAIEKYFGIYGLSNVMRVLCLVFLISAWGLISQTILFKELKIKSLTLASLISVGLASGIGITLAFLDYGVWCLVFYQLCQTFIYTLIIILMCKWKFSFNFCMQNFRRLFSFGFYTTISNIVETSYENILSFLFGKYLGVSNTGYLTQAKKIETASSSVLVSSINSVAFPLLAKLNNDKDKFIEESQKLIKSIIILVLPIFMCIAAYSEMIITLLFGEEWSPSAYYLNILMFVGCFLVLDNTIKNFLKALGYVKQLFMATLAKRIIALIIIIPSIFVNVHLIIYAYLLSSIIGFIYNWIIYHKSFEINLLNDSYNILKAFVVPATIYFVLYIIDSTFSGLLFYALPLIVLLMYYLLIVRLLGYNLIRIVTNALRIK